MLMMRCDVGFGRRWRFGTGCDCVVNVCYIDYILNLVVSVVDGVVNVIVVVWWPNKADLFVTKGFRMLWFVMYL